MEIVFPKIYQHQEDLYNAIVNDNRKGNTYVVKSRRQCGKSFIACLILIYTALSKDKSISIVVEPTLNQSRRMFKDITTMLDGSGVIQNANQSLLTIDFVNNSEIVFKSAEQSDGIRGFSASGVLIIDEGAYITDDVYEILFPVRDAHNAPLIVISTPLFKDGYFYKLYSNADSITFDWSKYDTSMFLSPSKLEYYRNTMSEMKFKTEYLGEFAEEGSFVFRGIKNCIRDFSSNSSVYCGIDWAIGDGNDYTVVTMMDLEGNLTYLEYFNDLSPSEQIDKIADIINNTPSLHNVAVEQNSIGNVYFDFLKKKVRKKEILNTFNTSNESKRTIIEKLAEGFNKQTIGIVDDAELIKELQHYAVEKTKKGYTYNGVNAHDDIVMSLAICYNLINKNSKYNIVFHK